MLLEAKSNEWKWFIFENVEGVEKSGQTYLQDNSAHYSASINIESITILLNKKLFHIKLDILTNT